MKHAVFAKRSRRGASIILAIIIFLLCALTGASALIMAAANAGRYSHAEDDQQPYYSVTSAAMLMIDLLDNTTYKSGDIEYIYERTWNFTGWSKEEFEKWKQEQGSGGGSTGGTGGTELTEPGGTEPTEPGGTESGGTEPGGTTGGTTSGEASNHPQTEQYYFSFDKEKKLKAPLDPKMEPVLKGELTSNWRFSTDENAQFSLVSKMRNHCDKLIPFLCIQDEWYSTVYETIRRNSFKPSEPYLDYSFTITPSQEAEQKIYGKISCRFIMTENFDLRMSFVFDDGNANNSKYAANVYWEAEVEEKTDSNQSQMVYTEQINGTEKGWIGTMTTTNKKSVTVTWKKENAHLSRGEAL